MKKIQIRTSKGDRLKLVVTTTVRPSAIEVRPYSADTLDSFKKLRDEIGITELGLEIKNFLEQTTMLEMDYLSTRNFDYYGYKYLPKLESIVKLI